MNKPEWKDAPEWAGFLAKDQDGEWYWFELLPMAEPDNGGWFEDSIHGRACKAFAGHEDWADTLESRP